VAGFAKRWRTFDVEWVDGSGDNHTSQFKYELAKVEAAIHSDGIRIALDSAPMWDFFATVMGKEFAGFYEFLSAPDREIHAEALGRAVQQIAAT